MSKKRILYFILSLINIIASFAVAIKVFGMKALLMRNVSSFMIFDGHVKEAIFTIAFAIVAIIFAELGKRETN